MKVIYKLSQKYVNKRQNKYFFSKILGAQFCFCHVSQIRRSVEKNKIFLLFKVLFIAGPDYEIQIEKADNFLKRSTGNASWPLIESSVNQRDQCLESTVDDIVLKISTFPSVFATFARWRRTLACSKISSGIFCLESM